MSSGVSSINVGDLTYRLVAEQRDRLWVAHAERVDTGERFGLEASGASEADALDRVRRWIHWQAEHAAALEALQQSERAYHRAIAGSAFASPVEGPTAIEIQKESLEQVEAARARLDEVRARRPE